MHILLLSCNTGQGHNSAALAIKDAIERRGDSCEMCNALLFLSQAYDKVISNGHTFIYNRLPKLFGVGYRFEERHSPNFIRYQMKLGVKKFSSFLKDKHFDAVISTHSFASLIVNEYKKKTGSNIISAFVATDYTCCPGAPESEADLYFIPHPLVANEFVKNNIDENKIKPYGIPVANQFVNKIDKLEARKALGLAENKKIVLIACGSMGCGPIAKIAALVSNKLANELIIVACGNNHKLFERITRLEHSNILPLSYTNKMHLYLSAADVFLSKAGGLSTSECIHLGVPLLYIDAIPGCETRNLEFMTQHGYTDIALSPIDAANKTVELLNNPQKAQSIISECAAAIKKDPAEAICAAVEDEIKKRKV